MTTFVEIEETGSAGRTPAEFAQLIRDLQENPGRWALYSSHQSANAAGVRAVHLRRKRTPHALRPHLLNLEFRSNKTNVLIRWVDGE